MSVKTAFPPGHFYSPIVDPVLACPYVEQRSRETLDDLGGITIDSDKMEEFWLQQTPFIQRSTFPDASQPSHRYYFNNGFYGPGDGTILRAMIGAYRPRKIIEIGSGFSTACMLDTLDELELQNETSITCIEPFTERLRTTMRASDEKRVNIIEKPVQEIGLELFRELQAGDIVFIDSTHVLKTGSDVHYELFYILPRVAPGVLVHFHDIHFPFEYPKEWLCGRNFSWNEVYAVRAFLMFNDRFRVVFYNDYFAKLSKELIKATFPKYLLNPGGALWLSRAG